MQQSGRALFGGLGALAAALGVALSALSVMLDGAMRGVLIGAGVVLVAVAGALIGAAVRTDGEG